MLIFVFQVLLSGVIAYFSSKLYWWLPLIVFPFLLNIFIRLKSKVDPIYDDLFFEIPKSDSRKELYQGTYYFFFDSLVVIVMVSWIFVSSIICYKNLGSWWAIPIGIIIGFVANVFLAPLRWRKESLER
jgi:hypothetical protein